MSTFDKLLIWCIFSGGIRELFPDSPEPVVVTIQEQLKRREPTGGKHCRLICNSRVSYWKKKRSENGTRRMLFCYICWCHFCIDSDTMKNRASSQHHVRMVNESEYRCDPRDLRPQSNVRVRGIKFPLSSFRGLWDTSCPSWPLRLFQWRLVWLWRHRIYGCKWVSRCMSIVIVLNIGPVGSEDKLWSALRWTNEALRVRSALDIQTLRWFCDEQDGYFRLAPVTNTSGTQAVVNAY